VKYNSNFHIFSVFILFYHFNIFLYSVIALFVELEGMATAPNVNK